MLDLPQTSKKRVSCLILWELDARLLDFLESQEAFIFSMNQEDKVVRSDLFNIFQSIVLLVEVNQPSEPFRVRSDNVVLALFGLSGNIATVGDVLYTQRRLQFDFVSFFFKRAERLQFKYQIRGKF